MDSLTGQIDLHIADTAAVDLKYIEVAAPDTAAVHNLCIVGRIEATVVESVGHIARNVGSYLAAVGQVARRTAGIDLADNVVVVAVLGIVDTFG